ncbi:MAG: cytochrome c biogenesis protein ResB [Mariprofundaceae bacterium]
MSSSINVKTLMLRLGSMPVAIMLLVVLALASVIGTVLLQNQEQGDYLQQFGPVWYWVFRSLGLFDMYHAWWFIGLLGFLMVSLLLCLWHNVPRQLKEMRSRKVTVADRAWKHMEHQDDWQIASEDVPQTILTVKEELAEWDWQVVETNGRTFMRGDKGRRHKWGYILLHSALLIILVGGWMSVQFGFRGNMAVPEGGAESEISFVKGTGVDTLDMPFDVRCNSFDIEFFPNGMPKLFKSNLTIIDGGKEVVTSDIIVNEPLYYKGVYIYQSSFGDGGSKLKLKLFRLDGSQTIDLADADVYKTYTDSVTGVSMEITEFKPYNVQNMAAPGEPKDFQDMGPAIDFILRGPGLKAVKVRSFMNPFMVDDQNQGTLMMVSLTGDTRDFQTFYLGLDLTNPKEWQLFHAFGEGLAALDSDDKQANLKAFKTALDKVYGDERPEDLQDAGIRTLQAMNTLPNLPWPFIPVLEDYEQVYYTGLQLAQDPGMNVVWVGSALLVIGLCIMFYVSHRKLWLLFETQKDGMYIRLGGRANRNPMVFKQEFHDLLTQLQEHLPPGKQGVKL